MAHSAIKNNKPNKNIFLKNSFRLKKKKKRKKKNNIDTNKSIKHFKMIKIINDLENLTNLGDNITNKEISWASISNLKLKINLMIDAFFQEK